jgi:predicted nucleic acid-binding protein
VRPYVVDTNLYVEALRSDAAAVDLDGFYAEHLPRVHLHSVVAQELLGGGIDPRAARRIFRGFIKPFEAVGRIITPTHRAWKRAGEIMAELVRAGRLTPGGFGRGFVNDCVLAASAREHGFVLVTRNTRDFELIRSVEPAEVVAPWPLPGP